MAGDMDGKGLTALQQLKRKSGQALDPLREEPVQEHLTVTSSALRPRGASKARKLKEGKDTESGRELEGLGWLHLREEMPSAGATAWHRRYLRLNEQKNAIQFFLRPPTLFGMDGDEKPLGLIPLPGCVHYTLSWLLVVVMCVCRLAGHCIGGAASKITVSALRVRAFFMNLVSDSSCLLLWLVSQISRATFCGFQSDGRRCYVSARRTCRCAERTERCVGAVYHISRRLRTAARGLVAAVLLSRAAVR